MSTKLFKATKQGDAVTHGRVISFSSDFINDEYVLSVHWLKEEVIEIQTPDPAHPIMETNYQVVSGENIKVEHHLDDDYLEAINEDVIINSKK